MKLIRKVLIVAALTFLPLSNARANAILNGGFENPNIATGTFAVFTSIPGWTTSFGPGIEIQDHVAGSPFEGAQHVELDSFANSGMIQTVVATTAGQQYDFRFAYSPRPGVVASSNGIEVYFGGALVDSLALSGTGLADTSWTVFAYQVTALGASSTIEFRAVGTSNSLGGYLDDVQLNAVPEPATLLLLGTGLVAACSRRLRGRKAS